MSLSPPDEELDNERLIEGAIGILQRAREIYGDPPDCPLARKASEEATRVLVVAAHNSLGIVLARGLS